MGEANRRLYIVAEFSLSDPADIVKEWLVRAGSQAQAIKHVVRGRFGAESASADEVVRLLTEGVLVQDAGEEG